jgi:hypothetical protein
VQVAQEEEDDYHGQSAAEEQVEANLLDGVLDEDGFSPVARIIGPISG